VRALSILPRLLAVVSLEAPQRELLRPVHPDEARTIDPQAPKPLSADSDLQVLSDDIEAAVSALVDTVTTLDPRAVTGM
jgi:hypothetical protein